MRESRNSSPVRHQYGSDIGSYVCLDDVVHFQMVYRFRHARLAGLMRESEI